MQLDNVECNEADISLVETVAETVLAVDAASSLQLTNITFSLIFLNTQTFEQVSIIV